MARHHPGVAAGRYGPGIAVPRAQMVTLLSRTVAYLTGQGTTTRLDYFDDDTGNLHEDEINGMAELGIATGVDLRRFGPAANVRRDQMASFLARAPDRVVETADR